MNKAVVQICALFWLFLLYVIQIVQVTSETSIADNGFGSFAERILIKMFVIFWTLKTFGRRDGLPSFD
jgi:hypothetical protein